MAVLPDQQVSVPPANSPSPRLYNEDLAPVRHRNWGVYNIFAMWMQDIHSITVYTFAASLFFMGLNGIQVFIALAVSVIIIWGLMNLSGLAGQRTGVPFPVLARSSFGVWGANIPAMIRAGIAVIYYGILTYLGSTGLQIAALRMARPFTEPLTHHSFLGLHALGWICFGAMWLIQLLVVRHGMDAIRRFQDWAGPAVWLVMFALAIWMIVKSSGDVSFDLSPDQAHGWNLGYELIAAIALNVSFFATFLVNFADFGRLAPNARTVVRGNFFGLPVNFILFAMVAVTVTSASIVVFGEAITDPVKLIELTDSTPVILFGALVFTVATIGINIVADFISCAYDFSNLFPQRINFFRGGIIAAVLSVLPLPWHLYNNPESIAYFVGGLGAFLGPLFGVLMSDFWIIRRGHVDVDELFRSDPAGRYYFHRGFNPRALGAVAVATLVAAVLALVPAFAVWAPFSWAIGAVLAAVVYLPLSWSSRADHDSEKTASTPRQGL
ncbi:NCS1 family nucleobase:cation symporter-1 [Mycolicibacterium porcinum]|uniref:NCS1 family nucleobase:cation symporter-1 n=1 Tax=Mycolicibacterium porcinum TaxID=39693 RepID=UPI0008487EF4|nr:NCS1 family nucleobase:cation symporter-1 [Mycolicibacterium porcinum]ODR25431.1 nitrate reductase [Mycolicibacterium porcinum]